MTNPRDFLPAKYKKPTSQDTVADNSVSAAVLVQDDESREEKDLKFNSPWNDLAKTPTVPEYRSQEVLKPMQSSAVTDSVPSNGSLNTEDVEQKPNKITPPTTKAPSFTKPVNKNNSKLAGLLVVFFLIVGVFASFMLSTQNQDNRQQASEGNPETAYVPDEDGNCPLPELVVFTVPSTGQEVCLQPSARGGGGEPPVDGECGAGMTLVNNNQTNQAACVLTSLLGSAAGSPNTDAEAVLCNPQYRSCPDNTQGLYGWCWDKNAPCESSDWLDVTQRIAGTYVWPKGCEDGTVTSGCKRYMINDPNTANAAVNYMANNPLIALHINENDVMTQANGKDLELAPFKTCQYISNYDDGYNTISCNSSACAYVATEQIEVNGRKVNQTRCYLTITAYQAELAAGRTWSPYNTGCGDGVHDDEGSSQIPGGGMTSAEYVGDCNTWHFTACLNTGSGANGLGCDIETPDKPDKPGEPPTTTPPPTRTPSPPVTTTGTPTPTPPPTIVCADIEMLDNTGNEMTGNDDSDLVNGDQVRFRSSSSGSTNSSGRVTITYEFRILPPNIFAWQDLTNRTGSGASDVSAAYTIISSGHHVVQSRICVDGVCQSWETQDEPDPITETSIFDDVAADHWAYRAIKAIYDNGITAGCATNPLKFCPDQPTTRAQAATMIMKAEYGADYNFTAAATPVFSDVGTDNPMRPFIEKMYADGITAGCGTSPLRFCPDQPTTRAQAATMIMRAALGSAYNFTVAATPIFSDVAADNAMRPYIEKMYTSNITAGCATNPLKFCPERSLTRAEAAVMLFQTFLTATIQ